MVSRVYVCVRESSNVHMLISAFDSCSYMDTEQYEEAVRDYEKVYQTEKTKGR